MTPRDGPTAVFWSDGGRAVHLLHEFPAPVAAPAAAGDRLAGSTSTTRKEDTMSGSWKDDLSTGISEVDAQHKELMDAIAALGAALAAADELAVGRTLEYLSHYCLVHFEAEERWMRANGFPLVREHVAKHDQFISRLTAMSKDHAEEGTSAVLRLRLRNALSWLEAHIEDEDQDLKKHAGAVARAR